MATPVAFTALEWQALHALRAYHRHDCEVFTDKELAHLRFVRWLHNSDRLEERPGPGQEPHSERAGKAAVRSR